MALNIIVLLTPLYQKIIQNFKVLCVYVGGVMPLNIYHIKDNLDILKTLI